MKTKSDRKKTSTVSDATKNRKESDVELALVKNSNKCNVCGKDFQTLQSLISHQRMHKEMKASLLRPFVCTNKTCSEAFHTEKSLKVHLRMHRAEFLYECNICGKKFMSLRGYKYHMMTLHSQGGRCTNCGKVEADKDALDTHFKACLNEAGYPCKVCGAVFRYLNSLKSHYVVHEKKKKDTKSEYQCKSCLKVFSHKSILDRHVRSKTCNATNTISGPTGYGKYTCYNCKKTFKTMHHFRSHINDSLCSDKILEEKNNSGATSSLQADEELDSKKRKNILLPQSDTKRKKMIGSNVSNVPARGDNLLVDNAELCASRIFKGTVCSKPEVNINKTNLDKREVHNESVERKSIHNDQTDLVVDANQLDIERGESLIAKKIDLPKELQTDCSDVSITERSVEVIPERMVDIDSLQDLANTGDGLHHKEQDGEEVIHVYKLTE